MTPIFNTHLMGLLKAREELLQKNPNLRELQFKINDLMAGAGSSHNKQVLLQKLMFEELERLQKAVQDLRETTNKFSSSDLK